MEPFGASPNFFLFTLLPVRHTCLVGLQGGFLVDWFHFDELAEKWDVSLFHAVLVRRCFLIIELSCLVLFANAEAAAKLSILKLTSKQVISSNLMPVASLCYLRCYAFARWQEKCLWPLQPRNLRAKLLNR